MELDLPGYTDVVELFQNERSLVCRAIRTSDGRRVVLKSVMPGTADRRARWLLRHEAQILAQLDMPGVVRSHGIEHTPLGPTLVLDDAGDTSPELVRDDPMALDRVLGLAVRLASILAELHNAGVLHRDINPHNVVIDTRTGEVCLIDFGLATGRTPHASGASGVGGLEGTVGYLSPEQTGLVNRTVDHRTDLFSLGATVYALLVGHPPFEGRDAYEVLYRTVARAVPAPHELRGDVPPVLSEIVLRLLAKDAEDRYQNAGAVAADLERCERLLSETGGIETFEIATTDRRSVFSLPERLYGRDDTITALRRALGRSQDGAAVFVGVAGAPGTGKTALTRELLARPDEPAQLVQGACSAAVRAPYAPIVQILRTLLTSRAHGAPERGEPPLAPFAGALEGDGAFLLHLMPDLEPLLDAQPRLADLPVDEAHDRMHEVLVRTLRACHTPARPLVLFLDDMQWADASTIALVERLLQEDDGGPMVWMAWREAEVGPDHPLTRVLRGGVEVLTLGPLDTEATCALVADALGLTPADVRELGRVVHWKTGGNPFFVGELLSRLVADGHLGFDARSLRWGWSIDTIAALPPTRNVAELLGRVLVSLPAPVPEVLGVAACLGTRFELGLLPRVARMGTREVCAALSTAIHAGLLTGDPDVLRLVETIAADTTGAAKVDTRGGMTDGSVGLRFVHDEVADAARLLLPDPPARVHLAAGRLLLERWRTGAGCPFAAADHLLAALPELTGPDERHAVAELSLAAGSEAAEGGAFEVALHYLEAGIGLLGPKAWQDEHALAFGLHLRAAEAARMCPSRRPAIDFVAAAMLGTTDVHERIALQRVRILEHAARYELDVSLRLMVEALSWVGVHLPRGAHVGHVAMAMLRTTLKVRGMGLAELRALPLNQDARSRAAVQLLAESSSFTYYADPLLLPVLFCRMVSLSLEHGVSGPSAFGCAGWAFLQIVTRGDVKGAVMWGAYARELVARCGDRRMAPKVELLVLGFIEARTTPLASLATGFGRACLAAREVGDAEYTAMCAMNRTNFSYLGGVDLRTVSRLGAADLIRCREMRYEQARNNLLCTLQAVSCLRGETSTPAELSGAYVDAEAMVAEMEQGGDKSGPAVVRVLQVQLLLLFGRDTAALLSAVEAASAQIVNLPGAPQVPPFRFHAALAWIRSLRERRRTGGTLYWRARKVQRELQVMADDGPRNFAHKARLIEAELADLAGHTTDAHRLYREAIRLARTSGMLHEEAMCLEWAALACERSGDAREATQLLQEARSAWDGWGATSRVVSLDEHVHTTTRRGPVSAGGGRPSRAGSS